MAAVRQTGEERGDLSAFQVINQPRHHPLGFEVSARDHQAGNRVHDDDLGLKRGNLFEHRGQVHLQTVKRGPGRVKPQEAALDQWLQAQSDRMHIADDLVGRFLEREKHHPLAAQRSRLGKVGRNDGLAGAGGTREQDAAAPKEPLPTEHQPVPVFRHVRQELRHVFQK